MGRRERRKKGRSGRSRKRRRHERIFQNFLFGPAGDRHEGIRPMLDGRAGYSLSVTTNGPLELASKLSGFLKRKKQTYGNYGPEEPSLPPFPFIPSELFIDSAKSPTFQVNPSWLC